MLKRAKQTEESGFTIIEVIIVLAIAGMILSFVLMALPALQRNSRNSQRRDGAHTVLAYVSQWGLNHSGNIPYAGPDTGGTFLKYAQVAYYDKNTLAFSPSSPPTDGIAVYPLGTLGGSTAVFDAPANNNLNALWIYNYQKCKPDGSGSSTGNGAGYNDVVALFAIEAGGGAKPQCTQL